MSHEFVSGFFSNNEPAWHGLGKVLPQGYWPGKEEAMRLAGHDFQVLEEPVFATGQELSSHKALFDDKGQLLSVVNRGYGVIPNVVPYSLIEAVANEGVKWHVGLVLERGRCAVVGYLNQPWTAPGDNTPTLPFITALWGHDGMTAFKLLRSETRVVCANTWAAVEQETKKSGLTITIRHTQNWKDYVERAKDALMAMRSSFDEYKELATELAGISVSEQQVQTFLEQFIPMPDTTSVEVSDRVKSNIYEARGMVQSILEGNFGTTPDAHRRTAYGLWQSGIEYLQHKRKAKTAYSRFNRSVLCEDKAVSNLHNLVLAVTK